MYEPFIYVYNTVDLPFSLLVDTLYAPFDIVGVERYRHAAHDIQPTPPDPDPLAGWKADFEVQPNKAIVDDYQDYIQKLPPDQRKSYFFSYYMVELFEDGMGQHAMQIEIVVNNHTLWKHVIIYNKSNNRIRALMYKDGHLQPQNAS